MKNNTINHKVDQLISVIVPVAPSELMLDRCETELVSLPDEFELIMVANSERPARLAERIKWLRIDRSGRAFALNQGAEHAKCDVLWFVHADSRLPDGIGKLLLASIARFPDSLLYFNLDYYDGGALHKLSAWGAKWRSRLFGAPFGDQAFCVAKNSTVKSAVIQKMPAMARIIYMRARCAVPASSLLACRRR